MDLASIQGAVIGALIGAAAVAYRHYRRCRQAGMSRPDAIKAALTITPPGGGGGGGPRDP